MSECLFLFKELALMHVLESMACIGLRASNFGPRTGGVFMRAVLQRVESGRVRIGDRVRGEIGPGIVALLGVGREDSEEDAGQ